MAASSRGVLRTGGVLASYRAGHVLHRLRARFRGRGRAQVASIVDGEARTDAPGGRLTSTNPARLDDVVAEVALGDAATFVDAARAARAAQKEWARCPRPRAGG